MLPQVFCPSPVQNHWLVKKVVFLSFATRLSGSSARRKPSRTDAFGSSSLTRSSRIRCCQSLSSTRSLSRASQTPCSLRCPAWKTGARTNSTRVVFLLSTGAPHKSTAWTWMCPREPSPNSNSLETWTYSFKRRRCLPNNTWANRWPLTLICPQPTPTLAIKSISLHRSNIKRRRILNSLTLAGRVSSWRARLRTRWAR